MDREFFEINRDNTEFTLNRVLALLATMHDTIEQSVDGDVRERLQFLLLFAAGGIAEAKEILYATEKTDCSMQSLVNF